MLGAPAHIDYNCVPSVIYTHPEVFRSHLNVEIILLISKFLLFWIIWIVFLNAFWENFIFSYPYRCMLKA